MSPTDKMAYDPNNLFAKIVRGEIPCIRVAEDAHTLAFMDIMPQADGHTLIVPKVAGENLLDTPVESLAAAIGMTQRVARAVRQAFAAPGVAIMQFNGSAAGQTVFHLHFHVIPRHAAELRLHARQKAAPALLEEHAARIRAALDH
jgi:histidine triad (HIT) family protein